MLTEPLAMMKRHSSVSPSRMKVSPAFTVIDSTYDMHTCACVCVCVGWGENERERERERVREEMGM